MPYDWITIKCPVCEKRLGEKKEHTSSSFICNSIGCSNTRHFFKPNETIPYKSIPNSEYYEGKKCKCLNCQVTE